MDISVSTRINSFVGLLGVDQSVLLLKKGNDIEPSMVFDELEKYGATERSNYSYYQSYNRDVVDFRDSRAIIITNAKDPFCKKFFKNNLTLKLINSLSIARYTQETNRGVCYAQPMMKMAFRGGGGGIFGGAAPMADMMIQEDSVEQPEMMMRMGSAPPMKKPIEVRKTFPETWLFDCLEFDSK